MSWWWSRSSGSSRWSCTVWGSTVASFYCSYYATSHYIKILWHINIPPYVVLRCFILSYFALFNIVLYSAIVHHVGLDCTLCMLYCSLMRFCFPYAISCCSILHEFHCIFCIKTYYGTTSITLHDTVRKQFTCSSIALPFCMMPSSIMFNT